MPAVIPILILSKPWNISNSTCYGRQGQENSLLNFVCSLAHDILSGSITAVAKHDLPQLEMASFLCNKYLLTKNHPKQPHLIKVLKDSGKVGGLADVKLGVAEHVPHGVEVSSLQNYSHFRVIYMNLIYN